MLGESCLQLPEFQALLKRHLLTFLAFWPSAQQRQQQHLALLRLHLLASSASWTLEQLLQHLALPVPALATDPFCSCWCWLLAWPQPCCLRPFLLRASQLQVAERPLRQRQQHPDPELASGTRPAYWWPCRLLEELLALAWGSPSWPLLCR